MKSIKPSGFQFSNPDIKKLLFQANDQFDESQYEGIGVSYSINVSMGKKESAIVKLQVIVGESNCKTPFYIELDICSDFRWTSDMEGITEKLLKQNAVTLLMSYARPVIAHITGDAGFRPFNLPFVDFRADILEMK